MIDYINEQICVIRGVKTIEINTRMTAQNGDNWKLSNVWVTRRTPMVCDQGFGRPLTVRGIEVKGQIDRRIRHNRRNKKKTFVSKISSNKERKLCKHVFGHNQKYFIHLESGSFLQDGPDALKDRTISFYGTSCLTYCSAIFQIIPVKSR
jgi:hypothetical protein